MELHVTDHAKSRIRKRFGVPKKAATRFAKRALRDGCIVPTPDGRQFVVRGDVVLVCEGCVVVTVINRACSKTTLNHIEAAVA